MAQDILIEEYKESSVIELNDEEIQFIRKQVNGGKTKIEIIPSEVGRYSLKATSFVGVIQLPSNRYRIQINPKISEINLLNILRYTLDAKSQAYNIPSQFQRGRNYLDILGLLFKRELDGVISKGLYKSYINEENSVKYLRGKLLVVAQIRENLFRRDRFFCSYDELSYNNLENQVVLYALEILIRIAQEKTLRKELLRLRHILVSEVTSRTIKQFELSKIHLSRLNKYYGKVIDLSKTIIKGFYFEDLTSGSVSAFSFLVDMNDLFEKFIFKVLKEEAFSDYIVEEQKRARNLVSPEDITIKPDVLISNKDRTRSLRLVIDTKYKPDVKNPDFYQVLAYSIAFDVNGMLLYPEHNAQREPDYAINKDGINEKIYIRNVALGVEGNLRQYVSDVGKQLKRKILPILSEV